MVITIEIESINVEGMTIDLIKKNKKFYVGIKALSLTLGLSIGQIRNETRKVSVDPLIKNGVKRIRVNTKGGRQDIIAIELNYLPVWVSSINRKSLNSCQFKNVVEVLNFCLTSSFSTVKPLTEEYQWEAELRDDLLEMGGFGAYSLEEKEVSHKYGIVDLLGRSSSGRLVGAELKKSDNFNDVIKQCKKHKRGLEKKYNEEVDIIICTLDRDRGFLEEAKRNGFEVYHYKRELIVYKANL